MGPLPFDRLEPNIQPFKYIGLDYFGPRSVYLIGRRTEKKMGGTLYMSHNPGNSFGISL